MDFLTGLHGGVATVLICCLLFVDEAGVPMPFAPNEVLLLVAGLLIASGSLPWFIIWPLANLAILLGTLSGYSWARRVGPEQLRAIAIRLHAERAYERARVRVQRARIRQLAVSRMIPGIRVYVTLAAGAFEVPLSKFLRGTIPANFIWTTLILALGIVVGAPAAHFFSSVEKLALSGALLVLLAFLAYRTARRAPRDLPGGQPLGAIPSVGRLAVAVLIDLGIVTVIAAGVDRLFRSVIQIRITNFPALVPHGYEFVYLLVAIAGFYVLSLRRGRTGETAGELVADVSYVHHSRGGPQNPAGGKGSDDAPRRSTGA